MHPLEAAIHEFLTTSANGTAALNEAFLTECLEKIKVSILDTLHGSPEREFKLRMSNIGRDLRQLMLEKKYGRGKAAPQFLLKMLTGHIQEHVLVYILKSAGIELLVGGEVSVQVADTTIDGTWDIKILIDNKIYDLKTASEWSYNNKFIDFGTLVSDDSFGYIDQLLGYCVGENCEPGGWIVMNKSTGDFKVVAYPYSLSVVKDSFMKKLENTINIVNSEDMPPCQGVIAEAFYKKPTGNMIIGPRCRWCSHKDKCHPTLQTKPSKVSKAKNKPLIHYVKEK